MWLGGCFSVVLEVPAGQLLWNNTGHVSSRLAGSYRAAEAPPAAHMLVPAAHELINYLLLTVIYLLIST